MGHPAKAPQGLKPATYPDGVCGTTEVVPCYRTRAKLFSGPREGMTRAGMGSCVPTQAEATPATKTCRWGPRCLRDGAPWFVLR
jgi:hypothetical protein